MKQTKPFISLFLQKKFVFLFLVLQCSISAFAQENLERK